MGFVTKIMKMCFFETTLYYQSPKKRGLVVATNPCKGGQNVFCEVNIIIALNSEFIYMFTKIF